MGFCNFGLILTVRKRNFHAGTKQWVRVTRWCCPQEPPRVSHVPSKAQSHGQHPKNLIQTLWKTHGLHIVGGIHIKEERVSLTFSVQRGNFKMKKRGKKKKPHKSPAQASGN